MHYSLTSTVSDIVKLEDGYYILSLNDLGVVVNNSKIKIQPVKVSFLLKSSRKSFTTSTRT